MKDRTENPYLPPTMEAAKKDPGPWEVAELRQFALRGVLVAASFVPFQSAFKLLGSWILPMLKTSVVARVSFSLSGVTLEMLPYGVLAVACTKLIAHRRSAWNFFAAGAGLQLGIILLEAAIVPIVPVLNSNVSRLPIAIVHDVLSMWLLVIIVVHLAGRRLSRSFARRLFAAVALSVSTTEFLVQGVALKTAGSQMWGFMTMVTKDTILLFTLALILGIGCKWSRPRFPRTAKSFALP